MLRGRRFKRLTKSVGRPSILRQNDAIKSKGATAEKLAREHGVTPRTIQRDGQFAEAVEKLKALDPAIEKAVIAGKAPPKNDVVKAAALLDEDADAAKAVLAGEQTIAQAIKHQQQAEKEEDDH